MRLDYLRKIATLIILAVFLSTKASGLHVLAHGYDHADLAHCLLCDHATAVQGVPLLPVKVLEIVPKEIPVSTSNEVTPGMEVLYVPFRIPNQLFSRPPPVI